MSHKPESTINSLLFEVSAWVNCKVSSPTEDKVRDWTFSDGSGSQMCLAMFFFFCPFSLMQTHARLNKTQENKWK